MAKHITIYEFGESTWFSDDVDGWRIEYRMRRSTDGLLVIGELRVVPDYRSPEDVFMGVPSKGIDAALLRRIRLGANARYGRAVIEQQRGDPESGRARQKRSTRGRPAKYMISFYRKLAARWRELQQSKTYNFAEVLSKEFRLSYSATVSAINRCRRKGLIPPSGRVPAPFGN
jgi:hypothetical protein